MFVFFATPIGHSQFLGVAMALLALRSSGNGYSTARLRPKDGE
jgi:hypothetical protein